MNAYTALIIAGAVVIALAPVLHAAIFVRRAAQWRQTLKRAPVIPISPDGNLWSDGSTWREIASASPSTAYRSPDGAKWWDGKVWHDVVR